jgi:hypothetical protein
MKIKKLWFILLLVSSLFSCKKPVFENAMSLSDLLLYTNSGNVDCDESLLHENDTIEVYGWTYGITDELEYVGLFRLVDSESEPQIRIDVFAKGDGKYDISRKISKNKGDAEYVKIFIRAIIKSTEEEFNDGSCKNIVYLEIDDVSDIQF